MVAMTNHVGRTAGVSAVTQVELPLPYDDEADDPIAFDLTARARRAVAPESLPRLRVVARAPQPGEHHDPDNRSDTRPARARALRRAGVQPAMIARQLGVEELLVRGWTGEIGLVRSAAAKITSDQPRDDEATRQRRSAYVTARSRAQRQAREMLGDDAEFSQGLGLVAGIATVDEHAVTLATTDARVAARVVAWGRQWLPAFDACLRVVVRVGPSVAADVVRYRWASAVGVRAEDLVIARARLSRAWPEGVDRGSSADHDRQQAMIRIADPELAAIVGGWLDALLEGAVGADTDQGNRSTLVVGAD